MSFQKSLPDKVKLVDGEVMKNGKRASFQQPPSTSSNLSPPHASSNSA
jgi:hypothetical protein